MQQVINSKDRTQAYWKFLLFFVITVMVVVIAVYFDFYMPSKENKLLKDEVYVQRRQEANQQKFIDKMLRAVSMLDSMDKSAKDARQLKPQVHNLIDEMNGLKENSGTMFGQLNTTVISELNELLDKRDMLTAQEEQMNRYKADLESCKGQAQQLQLQMGASARNF